MCRTPPSQKKAVYDETIVTSLTKNALVAWVSLTSACSGPSTCCGKYLTSPGAHREKPAGHV